MSIKTYKRSEKRQLAKNFTLDEFKCKCGKCDPILVDEKLVTWLQQIRDHFGKAVTINSAYRCEKHNASPQVGGTKGSLHVKGMAADFRVQGVTPKEVAKYAESIGILGIGLYEGKDGEFVHIDTRTTKSFWQGHAQIPVSTFGGKPQTVKIELPILRKGMNCETVGILQAILISYGYDLGKGGADDDFGEKTDNVLRCYQEDVKLDPDGICGKATWSKLLGV